jgi:hypothetical protein
MEANPARCSEPAVRSKFLAAGREVERGWGFDGFTGTHRDVPSDSRPGGADSYRDAFCAVALDAVVSDVVSEEESTPPHLRL